MRILASVIPVFIACRALCAEPLTALEACKALPSAQQKSIARVAGSGGKPLPETWTIVVHDPIAQNGIKEYTVTAGVVVASRGISDLATRITEADVIGLGAIRFDATQVAELAASYAEANQLTPASLDYDLRKNGADAAPLWKIVAADESGAAMGDIVVTATSGALVSQTGFAKQPEAKDLAALTDEEMADDSVEEKQDKPGRSGTSTRSSGSKSTASSAKKVPATFKRIGGHLQKFFTGKRTIGR